MWSKPQTLSSSTISLSSYCKKINYKIETTHVHFGTITKNNNFILHLNIKDVETLNDFAINNKKPLLGICVGLQMFADIGYEETETKGLRFQQGH